MISRSGEFDRVANLEKARIINTQAVDAIQEFSSHLSTVSGSDGVVVYGLDPTTRLASVLGATPPKTPDLKAFRREHLKNTVGYAVDLGVSGLGRQLRHMSETGASSAVETSRLGTYRGRHGLFAAQPLTREGRPVVVAQVAVDSERAELPGEDALEAIWHANGSSFDALADSVDDLLQSSPLELHRSLELRSSGTPNSGIVRWDLDNSTRLALSSKYGGLRNFLEDWRGMVTEKTADIPNVIINAGDGQNIVIMLPEGFDSADPESLYEFKTAVIDNLVLSLENAQRTIADRYSDLHPHVTINSSLGYIERNNDGSLDSPALWATALKTKRK